MQRDDALKALLMQRLARWPVQAIDQPGARRAAVLLAVVDEGPGAQVGDLPAHAHWSASAALVLTRRAGHMRAHAGQWALPGGRIDADESAEQAALREGQEEVALVLPTSAVLGRLDDYATRSGYVITPVVVWGGAAQAMHPSAAEVQSLHRIPLTEFLRGDAPYLDPPHPDNHQPVLRMPVGTNWIAAPTAALLYQFREVCLLDKPTRVAHFDQPRFTWK